MKALLVCAGYATRLFPLTKNYPKPLLVVGNKPIIEHIIENLEATGVVDEIIIVTNNKYTPRFLDWKEQFQCSIPITIINDGTLTVDDMLGPIGDIHFAIKAANVDDDLLIIAGDNIFGFQLKDFVEHQPEHSKVALYDLKDPQLLAKKFGVAMLDAEGKIINFEEKPEKPKTSLCSTMCYLIKKKDLHHYDAYVQEGLPVKESGTFFTYLIEKVPVHGWTFDDRWFDIGTFDSLEEADRIFASQ